MEFGFYHSFIPDMGGFPSNTQNDTYFVNSQASALSDKGENFPSVYYLQQIPDI